MKKITYSFPFVIAVSILIQGLGLLRSLILAKDFGASSMLDAFYLASVFTVSVFSVVGSAITTIVIPELNSKTAFSEKKTYIEKYLTTIRMISLLISLLLIVFVSFGRDFIAPGFAEQVQALFVLLTAILLFSQQFKIQASFSVSLLQNEGYYITPRFLDIIPVALPVFYLISASNVDLKSLTMITAVAYILETLIFNLIQRRINPDYVFRLKFGLDSHVRKMLLNTLPILLSSTVFQIQVLLSNYFAGFFGQGYITLLSNTNQIMGIFQSLFIMNLVNMVYPKLVKDIKKDFNWGVSQVSKYVSMTNFIVILLIWGFAAVGFELVRLLFVRGEFSIANAQIVYQYGMVLGFVLPFDVMRDYSYRIYYADGNTKKPMINSIITVMINVSLLIILSKLIGPISIVLAPAIGTFISMILILFSSRRDGINVNIKKIFYNFLLTNLLGILMFMVIRVVNFTTNSLLLETIINILIGVVFVLTILIIVFIVFKIMGKNMKEMINHL